VNDRQILRRIGNNVKNARLQSGLTQECLAELVGIHWKTLSGIERGLFPFAVTSFTRISQHLGVTADSLLEGVEKPDQKRANTIRNAMARRRQPKKSL
jgi:transcriptional regulator with XRE-family HTH domain